MNVDLLPAYIDRLERHIRQLGIRHTAAELDYIIAHLRREAGVTDADLPAHLRKEAA